MLGRGQWVRQGSMRSDARVSGEYATKGLVGERISFERSTRVSSAGSAPFLEAELLVVQVEAEAARTKAEEAVQRWRSEGEGEGEGEGAAAGVRWKSPPSWKVPPSPTQRVLARR